MEPETPEPKKVRKQRTLIENARLLQMPRGEKSYPAIIFTGDIPDKGDKIAVKLGNGVTYTGTVLEAVEADGEILVEFRNGLTPT